MSELLRVSRQYKQILLYSCDPGAYALQQEIMKRLQRPNKLFCDGWAYEYGHQTYGSFKNLKNILRNTRKKVLLLIGAQTNFSKTKEMIFFAKKCGVDVAFVFDQWKNYTLHFEHSFSGLPDYVFVPDKFARQILLQAFKEKRPRLSSHLRSRIYICPQYSILKESNLVGQGLGKCKQDAIGIFLDPDSDRTDLNAYSPICVLEYIKRYINQHNIQERIFIKPHPRQCMEQLQQYLNEYWGSVSYEIAKSTNISQLIQCSKEVWGMTSVCLVMAYFAGVTVKSFQWYDPRRSIDSRHPHLDKVAIFINKESNYAE